MEESIKTIDEMLKDLNSVAMSKYMNEDQYKVYLDKRSEIIAELHLILNSIDHTAELNTIKSIEERLRDFSRLNNFKSLDELKKYAREFVVDDPASNAVAGSLYEVIQFCIKFPDIAEKYFKENRC